MYLILNWWGADHFVDILTDQEGVPLYFESQGNAKKYAEGNLTGEYQIVEIHAKPVR